MLRNTLVLLAVAGLFTFTVEAALAQSDSNFTISPPPLAYPSYAPGSAEKISLATISVEAKGFEMSGASFNYVSRGNIQSPGEDTDVTPLGSAFSVNMGLTQLSGEGTGFTMEYISFPFGLGYEKELFNNDGNNFIAFGGMTYEMSTMEVEFGKNNSTTYISMLGFKVGGQMTFTAGSLKISPFFFMTQASGSAETGTYIYDPCCASFSDTVDINVSSSAYGFDILHTDSGITLSSILQQAISDKSEVNITILQISYSFGGSVDADRKSGLDINVQ